MSSSRLTVFALLIFRESLAGPHGILQFLQEFQVLDADDRCLGHPTTGDDDTFPAVGHSGALKHPANTENLMKTGYSGGLY